MYKCTVPYSTLLYSVLYIYIGGRSSVSVLSDTPLGYWHGECHFFRSYVSGQSSYTGRLGPNPFRLPDLRSTFPPILPFPSLLLSDWVGTHPDTRATIRQARCPVRWVSTPVCACTQRFSPPRKNHVI
jgi:hypothetical protein